MRRRKRCLLCRVWLNSYMEKNTRALMKEVNRNLRQTSIKDYNQLKVVVIQVDQI